MSGARTRRRTVTRLVSGTLAAWGVALLTRPEQAVRLVSSDRPEPRAWIVRLLGGRLVAQHALVLLRPTRTTVLLGVAVDTLHALSMIGVALLWREYRRPAAVSAATTAASALVGAMAAPQAASK